MLAWGTGLLVVAIMAAVVAFSGFTAAFAGLASVVFVIALGGFVTLAMLDTGRKGSRPFVN